MKTKKMMKMDKEVINKMLKDYQPKMKLPMKESQNQRKTQPILEKNQRNGRFQIEINK